MLRGPAPKAVVAVQAEGPAPRAKRRARIAPKVLVVYVAGAVLHPGLYTLRDGTRAVDAVAKAGGLRADADPAGVNLAQPLLDGEEIAAPLAGARRSSSARGIRKPKRAPKSRKMQFSGAAIDLNAADAGTLAQLPGIGSEMARRLVAFREANGDFASLDELADVAGMSQSRIAAVTPYLFINR
jgi:competence protein ComEA